MLYSFIKLALSISVRLFYSEIKVVGRPELLKGKGKIIVSNHPNTLMDAFLVAMQLDEPIHFMAKGTYFNSRFKLWLLSKFKMVPVQRQQDPENKFIDNKDAFKYVKELLAEGKSILIFPEGNSFPERRLRPIKTGTARIALETVTEFFDQAKDLKIYPIALKYVNQSQFRSKVLVEFNTPILASDYMEQYAHKPKKAVEDLTLRITWALRQKLLPILDNDYDDELKLYEKHLPYLTHDLKHAKKWNVLDLMEYTEVIIERDEELKDKQEEREALREKITKLDRYIKALGLRSNQWASLVYAPGIGMLLLQCLFYLILMPVYFVGMLNAVPFTLVRWLTRKITHEMEYYSAVNVALSAFLFPIYYALIIFICTQLGVPFKWFYVLGYFGILIGTGIAAYYIHNGLIKTFKSIYWHGAHYRKRELLNKLTLLRMECQKDLMNYLKKA